MRPTFEQTVDVLVKAYLNDELKHTICGCAVHNIVKHCYKIKPKPLWPDVFVTAVFGGRIFRLENYNGRTKAQIDRTGYTPHQLSDIEYAFERDRSSNDIFKCLMNVVDVLAEIHNVDLSVKENAKLLFVK